MNNVFVPFNDHEKIWYVLLHKKTCLTSKKIHALIRQNKQNKKKTISLFLLLYMSTDEMSQT